jgi:nitroreductase
MRRGPIRILKQVVRRWLLWFCQGLNDVSSWIQKHVLETTVAVNRAQINLQIPLAQMDQDLLGMYIRWNGHHVEKTVRYDKKEGRGFSKPALLRSALDEWYRRGYPRRRWTEWAEDNLRDFKNWEITGKPQIHPTENMPIYNGNSPVMEVLKNRVSTRYWKEIPVEREKIDAVLDAAVYAPTCCNRQTWKLYVRVNPRITSIGDVSNRALRERAPVAVYITIDNRLYPEIWAPAEDAGIIGLQLSFAATAQGLAGCLMYGSENFDQAEFRRLYDVPPYRYMYLMYLFGHPAERTLTHKRIHPDEVASFV